MRIAIVQEGSKYQRHEFMRFLPVLESEFPSAQISVFHSDQGSQTSSLAAKAGREADYLVSVGDDKTLHDVLNGCLDPAGDDAGGKLPTFCVFPVGTHSDFLHALDIKGDIHELCDLIRRGDSRCVDLGRVRYSNSAGGTEERYFINEMDVGIGASVLKHMVSGGKYLGGNLHYLEAILAALFEYRHIQLHVETDNGFSSNERTLAVVAINSGYHSDGICLSPDAELDDGQLLITIVRDVSTVDFLRDLHRLRTADHRHRSKLKLHKARWLRVTATSGAAPVQADGKFLGSTPIEIDVLKEKVRFLAHSLGGNVENQ